MSLKKLAALRGLKRSTMPVVKQPIRVSDLDQIVGRLKAIGFKGFGPLVDGSHLEGILKDPDFDWYAGPNESGSWSTLGEGDYFPLMGPPGFWRTYLVRIRADDGIRFRLVEG